MAGLLLYNHLGRHGLRVAHHDSGIESPLRSCPSFWATDSPLLEAKHPWQPDPAEEIPGNSLTTAKLLPSGRSGRRGRWLGWWMSLSSPINAAGADGQGRPRHDLVSSNLRECRGTNTSPSSPWSILKRKSGRHGMTIQTLAVGP